MSVQTRLFEDREEYLAGDQVKAFPKVVADHASSVSVFQGSFQDNGQLSCQITGGSLAPVSVQVVM
jgi:hypothetical protein